MEPPKITIVIPAYNEEKTIGNVINGIISTTPINLNILVINDCSKDNTSQVATSSGATVLNLINNEGYAGAINAGMNHAFKHYNSDYVITMDADGQHPTESVMEVIKLIRNDIDIIVGKRPYYGRFSEYIFSIYFKFKYNKKIIPENITF
ncbi:MAG: glycosyltransferase family 2 protein [Providencia sp.]